MQKRKAMNDKFEELVKMKNDMDSSLKKRRTSDENEFQADPSSLNRILNNQELPSTSKAHRVTSADVKTTRSPATTRRTTMGKVLAPPKASLNRTSLASKSTTNLPVFNKPAVRSERSLSSLDKTPVPSKTAAAKAKPVPARPSSATTPRAKAAATATPRAKMAAATTTSKTPVTKTPVRAGTRPSSAPASAGPTKSPARTKSTIAKTTTTRTAAVPKAIPTKRVPAMPSISEGPSKLELEAEVASLREALAKSEAQLQAAKLEIERMELLCTCGSLPCEPMDSTAFSVCPASSADILQSSERPLTGVRPSLRSLSLAPASAGGGGACQLPSPDELRRMTLVGSERITQKIKLLKVEIAEKFKSPLEAFRRLDKDRDSFISKDEFGAGVSAVLTSVVLGPMDIDSVFSQADKDGDGFISYSEFMVAFCL